MKIEWLLCHWFLVICKSMNIIDINNSDFLKNATEVLASGGVLVFPTDTVYGIGCALNKSAVRKLYKIKNRPSTQPTAVLMTETQVLSLFKSWSVKKAISDNLINDFLAGKLTIIFPKEYFNFRFPKFIISADQTVGVRLPNHEWLKKIIDIVGPIVATSANKKGERAPSIFNDIDPDFMRDIDLVIKSEENPTGKPSQVYDFTTGKFIRE